MRLLTIALDWGRALAGLGLGMYLAGQYAPGSTGAPWISAGALIFGEYLSAMLLRLALARAQAAEKTLPQAMKFLVVAAGPLLLALLAGVIVAFNLQIPAGKVSEVSIVAVYAGAGLAMGGVLALCDVLGLAPVLYPKTKKNKRSKKS